MYASITATKLLRLSGSNRVLFSLPFTRAIFRFKRPGNAFRIQYDVQCCAGRVSLRSAVKGSRAHFVFIAAPSKRPPFFVFLAFSLLLSQKTFLFRDFTRFDHRPVSDWKSQSDKSVLINQPINQTIYKSINKPINQTLFAVLNLSIPPYPRCGATSHAIYFHSVFFVCLCVCCTCPRTQLHPRSVDFTRRHPSLSSSRRRCLSIAVDYRDSFNVPVLTVDRVVLTVCLFLAVECTPDATGLLIAHTPTYPPFSCLLTRRVARVRVCKFVRYA